MPDRKIPGLPPPGELTHVPCQACLRFFPYSLKATGARKAFCGRRDCTWVDRGPDSALPQASSPEVEPVPGPVEIIERVVEVPVEKVVYLDPPEDAVEPTLARVFALAARLVPESQPNGRVLAFHIRSLSHATNNDGRRRAAIRIIAVAAQIALRNAP
jgi:hypothetical protein